MAIEFKFYGLTLFVWNRTNTRVLLPRSQGVTLPDGTTPRPHYPLYYDPRIDPRPIPLDGHTIEIIGGSGGRPRRNTGGDVIQVHRDKSHPDMALKPEDDAAVVSGLVKLRADGEVVVETLGRGNANQGAYRFGNTTRDRLACALKWVVTTEVRIIIRKGATEVHNYVVPPDPPREIKIGNTDGNTIGDLRCVQVPCIPSMGDDMPDIDFKIMYHLFRPVDQNNLIIPLIDCRKVPPAPSALAESPGFPAATTSTCFGGEWCDEPNPDDCP